MKQLIHIAMQEKPSMPKVSLLHGDLYEQKGYCVIRYILPNTGRIKTIHAIENITPQQVLELMKMPPRNWGERYDFKFVTNDQLDELAKHKHYGE